MLCFVVCLFNVAIALSICCSNTWSKSKGIFIWGHRREPNQDDMSSLPHHCSEQIFVVVKAFIVNCYYTNVFYNGTSHLLPLRKYGISMSRGRKRSFCKQHWQHLNGKCSHMFRSWRVGICSWWKTCASTRVLCRSCLLFARGPPVA